MIAPSNIRTVPGTSFRPEILEELANENTGISISTPHGEIFIAPDHLDNRIILGVSERGQLASAYLDLKKIDQLLEVLRGYRALVAKRQA